MISKKGLISLSRNRRALSRNRQLLKVDDEPICGLKKGILLELPAGKFPSCEPLRIIFRLRDDDDDGDDDRRAFVDEFRGQFTHRPQIGSLSWP